MEKEVIVYTDGGSRGNPGPAAIGAVINYKGEEREYSKQIGETTNNIAEYEAAIFALEKLKQLLGKEKAKETKVELRSDSELLVNQFNRKYKIKNDKITPLFIKLWNLSQDFGWIEVKLITREENKAADRLVNETLF